MKSNKKLNRPEIPPKKLFDSMHRNTYNFYNKAKNFKISQQLLSQRKKLINTLKILKTQLHFSSETFFQSIYYLDIIISKNQFKNINYISLCISCLIISAKFLENDPKIPQLSLLVNSINQMYNCNNFLSLNDLINGEIFVMKILKYKLNYFSVYDFDCFFFDNGIIKIEQVEEIFDKKTTINNSYIKQILEKIYKKSRILLDMNINNEIFLKYNSLFISIYIMKKSVEYVFENEYKINKLTEMNENNMANFNKNIEKNFIEIMTNFYGINYEISDEYKELVSSIQMQNNNKIPLISKITKLKIKSFYGEKNGYSYTSGKKKDNNIILRSNTNLNEIPTRSSLISSINLNMNNIDFTTKKSQFKKKVISPVDRKVNLKNYSTNSMEKGKKHVNETINYYQFITNIVNTSSNKKISKKKSLNLDTKISIESIIKKLTNKKSTKFISTSSEQYQIQESKLIKKIPNSNRLIKNISPKNTLLNFNDSKCETFRNNNKLIKHINNKTNLNSENTNNNIIKTNDITNKNIGIYSNAKYKSFDCDKKNNDDQLISNENKTNLNKRNISYKNYNNFEKNCQNIDIKKQNTEMAFEEIYQLQHRIESNFKKFKSLQKLNNNIKNQIPKKNNYFNSSTKKRNKTNTNYLEIEQNKKSYLKLFNDETIDFENN